MEEDFEKVLAAAAREVYPTAEITITKSVCVHVREQGREEPAEFWCSAPERDSRGLPFAERVRITVHHLQKFLIDNAEQQPEPPWERLMPLVRPVGLLQDAMARGGVVARPLVSHFAEIIGVDHPEATSLLNRASATTWDVSDERLFEVARKNLLRSGMMTRVMPIGATGQGGLFFVSPYGYQPSWLVFPRTFAKPIRTVANRLRVRSRQLVFPVERNEMFVLPEADETAIEAALEYALDHYLDDRRAMAPFALVHENGSLMPWHQPGNPLAHRSWVQRRLFVRNQYAIPEGHPDELAATAPLASLTGEALNPTATTITSDDIRAGILLPEVEYLDLHTDRGHVVVGWHVAVDLLGLQQVPSRMPSRWSVGTDPGHQKVWDELQAAAVDPEILQHQ